MACYHKSICNLITLFNLPNPIQMKVLFAIYFVATIAIGAFFYMIHQERKKPIEPSKPKLKMDSVCSTPVGHPVYKYQDGETTIYVIVDHSSGYPIAIATK